MADLTYIIKPGDYLSRIAQKYYGADLSAALADYNGIDDPDRINAGAALRLPAVLAGRNRQAWEPAPAPKPAAPPPAPTPAPSKPRGRPPSRPPGAGAGAHLARPPVGLILIGLGAAAWYFTRQ